MERGYKVFDRLTATSSSSSVVEESEESAVELKAIPEVVANCRLKELLELFDRRTNKKQAKILHAWCAQKIWAIIGDFN